MSRTCYVALAVGLLAGLASAQQSLDPTLNTSGRLTPTAIPSSGGARAVSGWDDFDRADGPMTGDWTMQSGTQEIVSKRGQGTTGQGNAWMMHNLANDSYDMADVEYDLYPGPSQGLNYVAAVTGVGSDMLWTKIQAQGSGGLFDYLGFYVGFNGGGFGTYGGFFAITPVSGGHIHIYVTNLGDTMNVDIDENFDGVVDYHYESSGILSTGLAFGTGTGIGTYGDGTYDNWSFDGGGPTGLSLSVTGLVAGGTATMTVSGAGPGDTIRAGYSVFGGGPTSTPWGNLLLSPPWVEVPMPAADAVGNSTASGPIPPGTTGRNMWFHAFDMNTLTFSNGVATTIG